MSCIHVSQSKSMLFSTKKNTFLVVISLLSSLFLSPIGAMTELPATSSITITTGRAAGAENVTAIAVKNVTSTAVTGEGQIFLGGKLQATFSTEVERKPRSTGWIWNMTSNPNENSHILTKVVPDDDKVTLPASENIDEERGQRESSRRLVRKQVHEDAADIIESRGFFTFIDFTTSPVPPTIPPTTTTVASTTQNNACVCVPYYFCDEGQVVVIADGSGVIDISHGHSCKSVLEVCCRNPKPGFSTSTATPPNGPTPAPTEPPVTALPGFNPQCGTLNPNGINARILGFKDSETQFGEYPWMGAVLESKFIHGKWVLQFLCGASLITPQVVLTAAHCVKGKRVGHLIIRLGEWDTQTTNEFYPYQDIKVAEFVIHPKFYGGGLYNDIAVVFLKTSVVLAPNVDTICLPEVAAQYDPNACWATGWGKNAFGPAGQYQAILREVELGIPPRDTCQTALRGTNLGQKFVLDNSFICAGGLKNLDTCIGDGGGPLVCSSLIDPWRYILVGIVSWGVKCGTYGVPGVYVEVPKFRVWIDTQILARIPTYNPTIWTISGSTGLGDPKQGG